jgi:hypothetical protein
MRSCSQRLREKHMKSRRAFLGRCAAAGLLTTTTIRALESASADTPTVQGGRQSRSNPQIKALVRREDTIQRHGGIGDCWHMSWAADGRQYASLCDGFGFSGQTQFLYNCNLVAIDDGPENARFSELPRYPQLSYYPSQKLADPRYYPFGTLALDGCLYQYMSTFDRPLRPQDSGVQVEGGTAATRPLRFIGAKLIYSPDGGHTWCNQDGASPVRWESWANRSRNTMLFFEESQDAFSLISVLQMGRNYEENRDGYVYIYSPNGSIDGTMNELVLGRVSTKRIRDRSAYEYFAGFESSGRAKWTPNMDLRKPIHTFPRGWVNERLHPYAWLPSVVFHPPTQTYLMTSWGMGTAGEGDWFAKPSYLGFWVATQPWGPWIQIHEETAWMPAGESTARAFQPQIAPKWIAPDGKSLWLVWTDFQVKGESEFTRLNEPLRKKSVDEYTEADWALRYKLFKSFLPYYSFNAQRVDLTLV